jgi:hypothetical protein
MDDTLTAIGTWGDKKTTLRFVIVIQSTMPSCANMSYQEHLRLLLLLLAHVHEDTIQDENLLRGPLQLSLPCRVAVSSKLVRVPDVSLLLEPVVTVLT